MDRLHCALNTKLLGGLAFLPVALLATNAQATLPTYNLTPLDRAPNHSLVHLNDPMDVNENGVIAGAPAGFFFGPSSVSRPVRWDSPTSEGVVLDGLSSGVPGSLLPNSYAEAVNNSSITVGRSTKFENAENVGIRAVYWLANSTTPVELPPAPDRVDSQGNWFSSATSITDGGLVAGESSGRPVIWNSVTSTPVELHSGLGRADSLNETRQAGGFIIVKPGNSSGLQPVRWEADGSRTDLAHLGVSTSGVPAGSALAINSAGDTAGYSMAYDATGYRIGERAAFWAAGQSDVTVLPLPQVGFDDIGNVRAFDMNDSSTIVGSFIGLPTGATSYESHGVLWHSPAGEMVILDSLLNDAAGWHVRSALAINELGWIAAVAKGPNERDAMVLLTPVPEPTNLALALAATLFYFGRRRR